MPWLLSIKGNQLFTLPIYFGPDAGKGISGIYGPELKWNVNRDTNPAQATAFGGLKVLHGCFWAGEDKGICPVKPGEIH